MDHIFKKQHNIYIIIKIIFKIELFKTTSDIWFLHIYIFFRITTTSPDPSFLAKPLLYCICSWSDVTINIVKQGEMNNYDNKSRISSERENTQKNPNIRKQMSWLILGFPGEHTPKRFNRASACACVQSVWHKELFILCQYLTLCHQQKNNYACLHKRKINFNQLAHRPTPTEQTHKFQFDVPPTIPGAYKFRNNRLPRQRLNINANGYWLFRGLPKRTEHAHSRVM